MIRQGHHFENETERQLALRSWTVSGFVFGQSAKWVLPILRPYYSRIYGLLSLGFLAACLGLFPPYLSKLVIDQGLIAGDISALILWSATLFVIGLGAVGLGALNNILHMRASVQMLADLRATILAALSAKPHAWFTNERAGELLARVDGDAGEVQQFAFNAVLSGLSSLVRLIGGTAMLMVLNWKLGLLAALLAPIELLFLAWARPRTTVHAQRVRTARGQLTAGLSEMLHGLPMLQVSNGAGWARTRSLADQNALNTGLLSQQRWLELVRGVPQILSAIMRSSIFLVGGVMVIQGEWPLGSLIAFIAYTGFMVGPMQSLLGLWHAQARVKVALARLDPVLSADSTPPRRLLSWNEGGVCIEDLQFGPDGAGPIGPVNAVIQQGTKLAVTGPSGSGKTSFLMTLAGHLPPRSGRIRQGHGGQFPQIAFASQRPFLLRGTLRENLFLPTQCWADPEMEKRVWVFLNVAGLSDKFSELDGLDTHLGESGLSLSGGERQRICLARAVLSPFDILILDEALSEVDAPCVARILKYIDAEFSDSIRIITTHNATTAYGVFDQTIDLAKGSGHAHCID